MTLTRAGQVPARPGTHGLWKDRAITVQPNGQRSDNSRRLADDIKRQLEEAFGTQEFSAYRTSQAQIASELESRLSIAVGEFGRELADLLETEQLISENAMMLQRQRRYLWLSASVPLLVALYFAVTIPLRYTGTAVWSPHIRTLTSVVFIEISAFVFAIILAGTAFAAADTLLPAARFANRAQTDHDRGARRYEARLRIFVQEQARLIIPTLPEQVTKSAFLDYSSAMVELALAEPISTTALAGVERFVRRHAASALGISGPRGAGKTTILSFLTGMERTLGVYIPAPVRYEPDELLARIFEELANRFLGQDWQRPPTKSPPWQRRYSGAPGMVTLMLWTYGLIGIIGLFAGGVALCVTDPQIKMDTARWLGVIVALSSVAVVLFVLRQYFAAQRVRHRRSLEDSPAGRAQIILNNLRWQHQQTSGMSVKVEPWGGLLKVASDRSATIAEREIGRPRLVADFQDFIRMITKSAQFDRIVIAIDELDKLPSAEDVISVINEIKDILHIEGTHVIVSVSHDALYRFLLRGLPSRDVFDSTFDEVIQVPLLTASEAVEVLQKRAVAFPSSWGITCYALSGGLPRDLLRYGRRCIEIYRESEDSIADVPPHILGELAAERVLADMQARGIALRLTKLGRENLQAALKLAKRGSLDEIRRLVREMYQEISSPIGEWLEWLNEVMALVQSGAIDDSSGVASALASRATSEIAGAPAAAVGTPG